MAAKKNKEEKTFNQVVSLEQARKQRAPLSKEERLKAIANTMAQVNKAHGEGSLQKMGDHAEQVYPHIPSGIVTLDAALGIGGLPQGRIVEVYGPESAGKTTTCLAFVAQCQKNGGIAAFVDAEHAFDPAFAKKIGVNIDELLVSQPMSGEEALEITESLIRSSSVDIIVVDSVAALVPRAELEGNMGDAQMGLHARLMSQAMRKLTGAISNSRTTVVFINQIRHKIGVMYGCFHYDTQVNFVDGRSLPIGKVVDDRIEGDVWSFNETTRQFEAKPIIDWHDNGKVVSAEDFLHIQTQSIDGMGRFGMTLTLDHEVLVEGKGWIKARQLSLQDRLVTKYTQTVNGTYEHFLRGVLVGDSHLSLRHNIASLRLQDNQNPDYVDWKLRKLQPFLNFTEREISRGYRYDSDYSYELAKLKHSLGGRDPIFFFKNPTPLGLAVWFMDDAFYDANNSHRRYMLSIKRYRNNFQKMSEISSAFHIFFGYENSVGYAEGTITFSAQVSERIANAISPFVPPCMEYKLPENLRGKYKEFVLSNKEQVVEDYVQILEFRNASPRQMRNKRRFDISVADNKNYMVGGYRNGVVVHNSPETQTGGNALKFYASVRMDVRRADQIKQKDEVIGNRVRVKIIKNKMAPPFRVAEYNLFFDRGFDYEGSVIDTAVQMGVVERSGAWYSFEGDRLGQGLENTCQALKENSDLYERVRDKVIEKLKQSRDLSFGERKEIDGKTVLVDNDTGEILDNEE